MNTLFDIRSGKELQGGEVLLMETGTDYCSYAFWHPPTQFINRLAYYRFEDGDRTAQLHSVLELVKDFSFSSVAVCSAFPQALLIPNKFHQDGGKLVTAIYQVPEQQLFYDAIPEWQLVNSYSVPKDVYDLFQQFFISARYFHAYTPMIKVYNGYIADNQLSVHFNAEYFRVLVKKQSAIQLVQTYAYRTPLDVVYYLLKICQEFELPPEEVHLILSGLVDEDSNLFKETKQYFLHVHFAHPQELQLPASDHPHHYFTSLYNLASCVS